MKRGIKLGNINFLDSTKGTAFFKFEHDPWLYRADRNSFTEAPEKSSEPKMTNSKYNSFETYFDTKFKNDDSCKVKVGSNKVVESNFTIKNMTFLGSTECALAKQIRDKVESKEFNVNVHKELNSNNFKQISFEVKGKSTNENLNLTIKNSSDKNNENVQRSFKLVHNYPFCDNFKVKVK